MEISVIIPTYGRSDSVQRVLEGLQDQTMRDELDILVIDQNESGFLESNLSAKAKRDIRFIQGERPNVSLARNLGAEKAGGSHLLFMDDDLEPEPHFCASLVEAYHQSGASCLAPLVFDKRGEKVALAEIKGRKDTRVIDERFVRVNDVISASFLIQQDLYDRIGGFDEVLFDYVRCTEDKDFFNRMNALNEKVTVDLHTPLFHAEEVEGGCELRKDEYWEQRLKFMKGWVYMIFKNNGEARFSIMDYWSLFRSTFLNRKAITSGFSYISKGVWTLCRAMVETRKFWKLHM